MYLGRNYLITLHKDESPTVKSVKEKVQNDPKFMARGADFLLHAVIDGIVDKYVSFTDRWDDVIEKVEEDVIAGKKEGALEKIMNLKRKNSELRRSIAPQREVINRLSRRDSPLISERASIYFRDVYDHIMRVYNILESQRDLISGIFEAYLAIVSNEMTEVSNRMNEVMKKLTIVATIFIPLTFVAGIYGMNFFGGDGPNPLNMPELYHPHGHVSVLLIMLFIGVLMLIYFRRKGWL